MKTRHGSVISERAASRTTAAFALKFLFFCFVLFGGFHLLPPQMILPVNTATAALTGLLLQVLGFDAAVSGIDIAAGGFRVRIITECTAVFVVLLFSAFVLAYPAPWKQRVIGLAWGTAILFAANLLRLVVVILSGIFIPSLFDAVHIYFAQIALILLVLGLSLAWLKSLAPIQQSNRTSVGFFLRLWAFASLLFLAWLFAAKLYVQANFLLVHWLLGHFKPGIGGPPAPALFPDALHAFNLVVYTALAAAAPTLSRPRKVKAWLIGLSVLHAVNLLFLLSKALLVEFHLSIGTVFHVASIILGQWVLPFGLWLAFAYRDFLKPAGFPVCPICGQVQKGLADHILAKHGRHALALLDGDLQRF
jgi:archaeosortase B (VPXXXP-CTERM-specific)